MSPTSLAPPPDPGPAMPVDVRPEDYYEVARTFADGQNRVMRAYQALTQALGDLSGAAGNDEPAQRFAETYTPAARSVVDGMVRLHGVLGGIARGLAESAENHRRADADAAGHAPGGEFPPLWPDTCPAAAEPAPILGDGDGNLLAVISDWVNPYYPNGHVDKMHDTAGAFAGARDALVEIGDDLHAKLLSLASNNIAEDLDALEDFWKRVAGGDGTLLAALPRVCDALAQGCGDYAIEVEHTRNKIGDIVEETSLELAAVAGIALVGSLLTTPAGGGTVGGAAGAAVLDAAAARMAVVVGQAVIAIGGAVGVVAAAEAAGALTAAINNTPDPNVSQAEATGVGNTTGTGQSKPPELKHDRTQTEKKYDRHAPDFGVDKPRGKEAFDEFEKAVRDFTQRPDLERMAGTYRGQPVFFQVDRNTGLFVMQKPGGEFLSGWRLNPDQLTNVLSRGKL
ncbi:hypothetical protein HUO13_07950 [Saccharopolyspora erythraea]|uniref:colicin D domain-containing protein n=1 Tax=Saccharopolyspora erythraea TaxID=1836 RepID=UPI001BAB7BE5|nr:colicin D domain-containing protein [Saccharopolyspora erythraea]QUH00755.1 hypothetical protein HUO13_07950 [Saccharopolyspora erythraea]